MAARLRLHHQEDVKAKIQASQLVNLLQNHALGKAEISDSRRDSAKYLLNKVLSNPAQVIAGDATQPLSVHILRFGDSK